MGVGLNRVGLKASRQTTLQTVIGSPVKGGAHTGSLEEGMPDIQFASRTSAATPSGDTGDNMSVWTDIETDHDIDFIESPIQDDQTFDLKGKAKEHPTWKHQASRRASLASQFLSESLSELPQTPDSASTSTSTIPKRQHTLGLRSASREPSATRSSQATAHARNTTGGSNANTSGPLGAGSAKSGALTVLKNCSIYVDVRTDDGDDAGSLFVDMLRGMGARVHRIRIIRQCCD